MPPSPLPEETQQRCQTPGQGTAIPTADAQRPALREAGTSCLSNLQLLRAVLLKRMVCFLMKIHLFQLFCRRTDLQKGFLVYKCTWWSTETFQYLDFGVWTTITQPGRTYYKTKCKAKPTIFCYSPKEKGGNPTSWNSHRRIVCLDITPVLFAF